MENFKYLDVNLNSKNDMSKEKKTEIKSGKLRVFYS